MNPEQNPMGRRRRTLEETKRELEELAEKAAEALGGQKQPTGPDEEDDGIEIIPEEEPWKAMPHSSIEGVSPEAMNRERSDWLKGIFYFKCKSDGSGFQLLDQHTDQSFGAGEILLKVQFEFVTDENNNIIIKGVKIEEARQKGRELVEERVPEEKLEAIKKQLLGFLGLEIINGEIKIIDEKINNKTRETIIGKYRHAVAEAKNQQPNQNMTSA